MNVLKTLLIIVAVLVFLVGVSLCAFPYIHDIVRDNQMKRAAQDFLIQHDVTTNRPSNAIRPDAPSEPTVPALPIVHKELWQDMTAYNQQIWEERQEGLSGPRAYSKPSFILSDYGLDDEIFGVVSIPTLELEMPLYLGASTANMAKGAAHMSQTSLPIGGINTNCVIAGHCGHNGAAYFRYVTELSPGDKVIITNLWGTMTYTVTETQIIWPNEVDEVLIREGRDMITLLTCYPYASGGRQRYLVFCDRETNEQIKEEFNVY